MKRAPNARFGQPWKTPQPGGRGDGGWQGNSKIKDRMSIQEDVTVVQLRDCALELEDKLIVSCDIKEVESIGLVAWLRT